MPMTGMHVPPNPVTDSYLQARYGEHRIAPRITARRIRKGLTGTEAGFQPCGAEQEGTSSIAGSASRAVL